MKTLNALNGTIVSLLCVFCIQMEPQTLQSKPALASPKSAASKPVRQRPWRFAGRIQSAPGGTAFPHLNSRFQMDSSLQQASLPAQASSGVPGPWIATRTPLPAGEVPTSVAMGDFNNDGKMDWVVAIQPRIIKGTWRSTKRCEVGANQFGVRLHFPKDPR